MSTVPNRKIAQNLVQLILQKRLAACVNISSPVESIYWWQKKIEKAKEYVLFIKTTARSYKKLERLILAHHPYSVPEILSTTSTSILLPSSPQKGTYYLFPASR